MQVRRAAFVLGAAALSALSLSPFSARAAQAPADGSPLVVGTDVTGDWGGGGDLAVVGHAAAQDLTGAAIRLSEDGKTVNFIISLSYLPSTGVPEASRYTWSLLYDTTPGVHKEDGTSDATFLELDGKYTNYSRGVCDPTSGKCPPPRDPGERPFFIRGDCTANAQNVTTCREIGLVKAAFDANARTITVPVPVTFLGGTAEAGLPPCTAILPGPNLFGGSISAAPAAFVTSSAFPLDTMELSEAFETAPATPDEVCPPLFSAEEEVVE